jgi:hypothetical protein
MKVSKNQVVRIKNYKSLPSGWRPEMMDYCNSVVLVAEIIKDSLTSYRLKKIDNLKGINNMLFYWFGPNFQKVNTRDKKHGYLQN